MVRVRDELRRVAIDANQEINDILFFQTPEQSAKIDAVQFHLWRLGFNERPRWQRALVPVFGRFIGLITLPLSFPFTIARLAPKIIAAAIITLLTIKAADNAIRFEWLWLFLAISALVALPQLVCYIGEVLYDIADLLSFGHLTDYYLQTPGLAPRRLYPKEQYEALMFLFTTRPISFGDYAYEANSFSKVVSALQQRKPALLEAFIEQYWENTSDRSFWRSKEYELLQP